MSSNYTYENKKNIGQLLWEPSKYVQGSMAGHDCFFLCSLTDVSLFLTASDYPDQGRFSWSLYLEETGSKAVPAEAFKVVRTKNKCTVLDLIHSMIGNDCTWTSGVAVMWFCGVGWQKTEPELTD